MPLTLPNLDDLTWNELVREGLAQIPSVAPEWTNHNSSDPGITLVELFAFYTSLLLYRVNRIGDQQTERFFDLLAGRESESSRFGRTNIDLRKRSMALERTKPMRAVTAADYESIAIGDIDGPTPQQLVARAKCVPDTIFITNFNQDAATEVELTNLYATSESIDAPGHLTVIVLPLRSGRENESLLQRLKEKYEQVRLLTTHVHVALPRFVEVGIRVILGISSDAHPRIVRAAAAASLKMFFDPFLGGPDGEGYPFGRNVYVSDIYQVLGNVPGIDYVKRNKNPETYRDVSELKLKPEDLKRLRFNSLNEVEAVEVYQGELVELALNLEDIASDREPEVR